MAKKLDLKGLCLNLYVFYFKIVYVITNETLKKKRRKKTFFSYLMDVVNDIRPVIKYFFLMCLVIYWTVFLTRCLMTFQITNDEIKLNIINIFHLIFFNFRQISRKIQTNYTTIISFGSLFFKSQSQVRNRYQINLQPSGIKDPSPFLFSPGPNFLRGNFIFKEK